MAQWSGRRRIIGLALIGGLLLSGCASRPAADPEAALLTEAISAPAATEGGLTVTVDGEKWTIGQREEASGSRARVYIWMGNEMMGAFPFENAHTIVVRQADGSENIIRMTGSAVYMEDATCRNHDCVQMGEITMENLETRVMGGFIVCLPQGVMIEVREEGEKE